VSSPRYGTTEYRAELRRRAQALRPDMVNAWHAEGYTIADPVIAAHLGATLAVTTAEGARAWREELGL